MHRVSLYIPAFNAEPYIERCVRGALAQTYPIDEILIIDDGSNDGTVPIANRLQSEHETVRLIRHDGNLGLGAARNTGISSSRHQLIASLDADTCPEPTWLKQCLGHFDDPRVAAAGGMLVEAAIHGIGDRFRRAFMSQNWGRKIRRNPWFLFGNNMIVRKSVVQSVGGYDAHMRTAGDDVEISAKIRTAGYDTVYDPNAVVEHFRTDTVQSIFDTQWRWFSSATKLHICRPSIRRTTKHVGFFFLQSVWRAASVTHAWLDPPVFLLNIALPFYETYRHLKIDMQQLRQCRWNRGAPTSASRARSRIVDVQA